MKIGRLSGIITLCAILMTLACTAVQANGAINVKDYGAVGDGIKDDTAAIQLAIDSAREQNVGEVYFPKGTYITVAPIKLTSDMRLMGMAQASTIKTTMTGDEQAIFEAETVSGVEIENLVFEAVGNKIYAAKFSGSINIQLADNVTRGCALAKLAPKFGEEKIYCDDILIKNNNINGADKKISPIVTEDVHNGIVTGNIISNFTDGIKLYNNDEAIYNFVCSENVINHITGCGIEADNLERLTIGNNTVKNTGCGISVSNGRYVTLMSNIVTEFSDRGIVLRKGGKGLNINANEIYSSREGAELLNIENADTALGHKSVNITANTFHGLNGVRTKVCGGDAQMISVSGNHFYNTTLDLTQNKNSSVMISGNQFIFEGIYKQEEIAIKAGPTDDQMMIQNNQIREIDENPNTTGIYAHQNDSNISVVTYIKGNSVSGMNVDIKTVANSTNPLIKPMFLIKNNYLENENYIREEGNTQSSVVRLEDNYTTGGRNYPSQIPTMGKWEKGQIIYFNNDNQNGYIGAVCIAKGTPGIWKYFGEIAK